LYSSRLILISSYTDMAGIAAGWLADRPETLILGPTRAAADELARAACAEGLLGVHRLTPMLLATELSAALRAQDGLAPVSRLGMEALAARVVARLLQEGKLSYFRPVADAPGFARALALTLDELRNETVPPPELAKAGLPGADLAQLAVIYEEELRERALADRALTFRLATAAARERRHHYLGIPLLLLDPRIENTCQRELIAAVAAKAPAVLALALDADEKSIAHLREILQVHPETHSSRRSITLDHLRGALFSAEPQPKGAPDDSLEFFSTPGEGLECVEIARRISGLVSGGGAFDRIAILLRNPERYQPLVEEAMRRAAIPAFYSRGSARPDAAGRAFLALLACAAEGCTASRFAEYLSLGQAPAAPPQPDWVAPQADELGEIAAPEEIAERPEKRGLPHFAWEKLLVDAAVVGGSKRWERRLRGLEQEFRLQLAELDGDEAHAARIERQLETLLELERFALPLIEKLAALPPQAIWREWIERLGEVAQTALRDPESALAVLAELEPMGEVGPASLDEVFGVLSERLRFLRREPPVRRYGCVFVGAIDEARARSFDVVFLPGLAEGLFPRRAFEDPLLLDVHRRTLTAGLTLQNDRVARERLLLRIAAAAASTRLVVSYPRMDAVEARPRVPSFYAMEVVRAAEGRLPDLRNFEKRAASAAPARLGWPAPLDQSQAIDDAEYDLATLGPYVNMERRDARGKGRYLLQANQHLARSLRGRWRRWKKSWSAADGIVDPDAATLAVLAGNRLGARSYSPSALQHFAACPYRFLLHGIHRLRPRDEAVALERMDPLTRGSLFHAAQFVLFRRIESNAVGTGDIYKLMDRVLEEVAAEYAEKLAPAIPGVWATEVEDLRIDLRGWLRNLEKEIAEWRPTYYEYAFGLPRTGDHDPNSTEEPAVIADGVRLRGSMDVVERHGTRGVLRITDHKTGKPPAEAPVYVGRGLFLQPLLYALAAEKLLDEPVESGRLYYCTQRGGYQEYELRLTDTARAQVRKALGAIDEAIEKGFLPAAPQKDACHTCDYRPVCGPYEEMRSRSKKPDVRMEALLELRSTP
jgi:CRISPR/Cas system-associated exonuclease Cas4 (RecB family)